METSLHDLQTKRFRQIPSCNTFFSLLVPSYTQNSLDTSIMVVNRLKSGALIVQVSGPLR